MSETPASADHVGDIAIVLHSHMPYVEGFGTYPFGEEWLFDAVVRSHLPVLERARDVTLSITPVLADQLEAPGVAERLVEFARVYRLGSAQADVHDVEPALRDACEAEAERYRRAVEALEATGGRVLETFAGAAASGRVEILTSTATHAVLPLVATREGRMLQLDAGLRSHRRRFGVPRGVWLPECAYSPGLEHLLSELGFEHFCVDQSAHEPDGAALRPIATGGPVAFPIDWPTVERVWSLTGYPSASGYADFHRKSLRGTRPWAIDGSPYRPEAAAELAREQGRDFARAVAERLRRHRAERGSRGLLVFAIDTELLGHWWWEGPEWFGAALEALPVAGVRPLKLSVALEEHPAERRPLATSSWGEGKDLRTWDSPSVADLTWTARSLELRVLREVAAGRLRGRALMRAARELLAIQSSDWAFLDYRRQAGDYPFRRMLDHSRALFESIDSGEEAEPGMRSLAPDLSPAPLLEP